MAKGGYQRKRIQQKKDEARARRKRAERNRKILTWAVVVVLVGGLATGLSLGLTGGGKSLAKPSSSASPSASPTATSLPAGCTAPGPITPKKESFKKPPLTIDTNARYIATVKTSCGTIKTELYAKDAPETVNSFAFLADKKFFDGLTFHRVIPTFGPPATAMIQGGDPLGTGTGGPGYEFKNENTIPFTKAGYLAMANSGPDTNGSQFFFLDGPWTGGNAAGQCVKPSSQGCYSVFGRVLSGMNVVKLIASVPRGAQDKPNVPVEILSVTVTKQ